MSFGPVLQDPDETAPYSEDWSTWLGDSSISASAWSISPSAGVTLSGQSVASGVTECKVAGLTRGHVYELTNRVTAADGSVGDRSVIIRAGSK